MLVLEIEFLLGVSFAALGPDSAQPDWPPQPDRVFSALVASWAARGERPEERAALEWLEAKAPPDIVASACHVRPAPTVFVPPNDPASGRVGDAAVLPALRGRQPRRFPAALPQDPIIRLVWGDEEDAPVAALDDIARDVAAIGHSASLARCRFLRHVLPLPEDAQPARRRVYPGRLAELEAAHRAGRRPSPGADTRPEVRLPKAKSIFSSDWLVFEIGANDPASRLDIRAAPIAAKKLRDALMSGYGAAGVPVPGWVSGHHADGMPTRNPHLAVVPLSFTGFAHADGSLLGFALVPPASHGDLLADTDVVAALRCLTTVEDGERGIWLRLGPEMALRLRLTAHTEVASLNPSRYCRPSNTWASVTPIVLDRHLKGSPEERAQQAVTLVEEACVRLGLPRPLVRLSKHAALRGAVSAAPSGRAPSWTAWRLPPHVAGRALTHAVLQFPDAVPGPVILGAGRFCGLGLCLPTGRI